MHTVMQWQDDQQVTAQDLTSIGTFGRETIDFLTGDALSTSNKFAGFPIVGISQVAVNIGAGRFYKSGVLYANADQGGVALDLTNFLPLSAGNTRIVSIVAYGTTQDTDIEPRTYELDASAGTTEARQTAVENERHATIVANALAAEGPSPVPPPIAADQVEIARVVLGSAGIQSIAAVEANRLQTIDKLDHRTTDLETFEDAAGKRIATLGSDLATLAARFAGLPTPAIFTQITRELSQLAARANLPQTAINFHTDYLLSTATSASDTSNASYYALVQEGIRFPWAAQKLGLLKLFNPTEPKIQTGTGTGIMLPAYTEAARIDTIGNDGSLPISFQYQSTTAMQVSLSRQVINFGPSFTRCQNSIWWQSGKYDKRTGIFSKNGETYQATLTGKYYTPYDAAAGDQLVRLQEYWTSTVTDTYTNYLTTTVSVVGSALYQTFLASQAGWLTSIDVAFTAVAATGDVSLMLCATSNGAPDFTNVLANVTVPVASLKTWPATTNFPLKATYLDPGTRYAIVLVSPGNHSVAYVANDKYAQGACGYGETNGAWTQLADVTKDLAFRANYAKFTATICQVQMDPTPFSLDNGITAISLLYGSKIPDGCQLVWEIQVGGLWYPLQSYATAAGTTNPLLGLPPLVPVRVTYIGTTDLMPAIDMTQTQTLVSRPAGTYTHISTPITIGAPSSTIKVELVVDDFDPAHHTVGCGLIVGGAAVSPSTATVPGAGTVDPDNPRRFTLDYVFSLGSSTSVFAIKTTGTTDAVTAVYHVESRFDYET